jgi:tRNA-splicing ligase RtcB (3'-phosphate/5'-hydroxy nucleic acid ligase)
MPDAHQGYGLPIGGVLATKNAVIPYAVGVDIACRMRISILDIPYEEFEKDRRKFGATLLDETRFGVGVTFEPGKRTHKVMEDPLWRKSGVVKENFKRAASQLGTSGHGNHFVEFGKLMVENDVDEPTLKIKAGIYTALLSHSGSRGLGLHVANHFSELAQQLHPELPENLKRLAWLELDSQEGKDYWEAMELCGKYAEANHELIHESVIGALGCGVLGFVENHHNFAWKEMYDGEELIVHRKGATPAGKGKLGVVPGSMGSPGFIVRGKGNAKSFNSCSHGAGNIHADSIRNHCVFSRQHAADRETVTLVSIRHQSASDGNRQTNSLIHLFKRSGFDLFCAPQLPRYLFFPLAVNDSATSEFLQFFGCNFEIFSNFFRDIYLLQDFCRIGRYRQFADQRF